MLQTWFKDQQIVYMFQNFQFHFHYQVMSNLSKHKSHNYTTVQMVCWLSSVPSMPSALVWILPGPILTFFLNFFFTANWVSEHLFTCFWTIQSVFMWSNIEARTKHYVFILQQTEHSIRPTSHTSIAPHITTTLKPDNRWLYYTAKKCWFLLL